MDSHRLYNFAAGPATLPIEVLRQAAAELPELPGQGMSVLEMSHRSPAYRAIHEEALANLRQLLAVPDSHEILFLQGGGHLQFAMVPLNLLGAAAEATYIVNGVWSRKAASEAARFCHVNAIGGDFGRTGVPPEAVRVQNDAAYLYYCQNETVNGIEFSYVPETPAGVPLVSDVSSNFLSRPIDFERHALVFAGAQKNFGPAGLTVVIVRKSLLGMTGGSCPTMLDYATHAKAGSMYNTPPVFAIWISCLVSRWLKEQGGVAEMERRARARSALVYRAIDESEGFYVNQIEPAARSRLNVVFTLAEEALTELFIKEAAAAGLVNLKGHRLVGGLRASLYNALPLAAAAALAEFMTGFARRHG